MPGVSSPGAAAAAVSSSSSGEQLTATVTVEKDPQHDTEAAFHLNPTEPHSYQVLLLLIQ